MFTLPSALSFLTNKYVLGSIILALVLGGCYYTGYERGSAKYVALEATYKAQTQEAIRQAKELLKQNEEEKKQIEAESQQQINSMSVALADLGMRYNGGLTALQVCTSASTSQPSKPATGSGSGTSTSPAKPVEVTIGINQGVLSDTIDTAIAAINAELEWRKYARSTGQVQ